MDPETTAEPEGIEPMDPTLLAVLVRDVNGDLWDCILEPVPVSHEDLGTIVLWRVKASHRIGVHDA